MEKTHGDFVSYFKNGQKNETGAYVFGVKTGEWIYRHKSGYPRSAGSYDEQGEQTGPWKSWFENGRVDSEGEFVNDEKHGTWTYYHRNSQVSSFEKYEHGELKNVQSWDEQGKVVDADYEVERMPEFPGGVKALYQHLSQQIAYPPKARQEGIEGKVYVEFTIDTDGSIEDATVVKGSHPLLNAAAVKAVSKLPKWKPGIQHNRIVKVKYTLPVNFQLK